jgi:thioredoxin reductase (NADPH)
MAEIQLYGADWCPDCKRSKRFLADQRIPFAWHDIEADPEALRIVQERNGGKNIIPTIVFPDGTHLAEPSNEELADKLGIPRVAKQHVYDLVIVGAGRRGSRRASTRRARGSRPSSSSPKASAGRLG